jgi:phosphohistidine phosphatase
VKRLVLIRHAKSGWGQETQKDFDRPLNPRGEKDAPRMARALVQRGIVPDLIISSPAKRALTTAALMAQVFGYDPGRIEEFPPLYLGNPSDLSRAVDFTTPGTEALFLFAHNPGISYYASALAGEMLDMPTCCAVICEIEGEWTDFRTIRCEMLIPKALPR